MDAGAVVAIIVMAVVLVARVVSALHHKSD
jgi:hypothetical protein